MLAEYLNVAKGETVSLALDVTPYTGLSTKLSTLMMLVSMNKNATLDMENRVFKTPKAEFTFGELGISEDDEGTGEDPQDVLLLEYEQSESFEEPNGKYSLIFGNVAILDCNQLLNRLLIKVLEIAYNIPDEVKRTELE
jgi:hypothetical protein